MPDSSKKYKGISYKSLVPIFKNLDAIFAEQYPAAIADIHAGNIKGMIIQKCCNGEIPTEYECDLYRRLLQAQSRPQGCDLINNILTSSHKSSLSRRALASIHAISRMFNKTACQNIIDCILESKMDKKMHLKAYKVQD